MAGASQRFRQAGYADPKFMLPLHGRSVFTHAVGGFDDLFDSTLFVFIIQPDARHREFVEAECRRLGVQDFCVVALRAPTDGQAETVAQGLKLASLHGALTIFNIDTFRPGFSYPPPWFGEQDGWLEVFEGEGENWSYVRPAEGPDPMALETAEKRAISNLCCTGLYHFARSDDFHAALSAERSAPQAGELYVAPLYNHLIRNGASVAYRVIERNEVQFCGTPQEYEALKSTG